MEWVNKKISQNETVIPFQKINQMEMFNIQDWLINSQVHQFPVGFSI